MSDPGDVTQPIPVVPGHGKCGHCMSLKEAPRGKGGTEYSVCPACDHTRDTRGVRVGPLALRA